MRKDILGMSQKERQRTESGEPNRILEFIDQITTIFVGGTDGRSGYLTKKR